MTIEELKAIFGMTIHELIEMIKLRGEALEYDILSLPKDKYCERANILFEDRCFVICEVLDNYEDICHYEDIALFENEFEARIYYDNLVTRLNGEVYE